MPISAEAPWLNYYGAIPRTLNYPRLTIYQLVAQTARELGLPAKNVANALARARRKLRGAPTT